jgi:hypothetical protein
LSADNNSLYPPSGGNPVKVVKHQKGNPVKEVQHQKGNPVKGREVKAPGIHEVLCFDWLIYPTGISLVS